MDIYFTYIVQILIRIFLRKSKLSYFRQNMHKAIVFLIFILAFNLFKIYLLKKDLFYNKPMYNLLRLIEIAYILFSVIIIGFQQWVYILLVFPILIITLEKGKGRVRHFLIFSLILSIIFQGIKIYSNPQIGIGGIYFYISKIVFLHAMLLIFSELCKKYMKIIMKASSKTNIAF